MVRFLARVMLGLECPPDINDGRSAMLLRIRSSLYAPLEVERTGKESVPLGDDPGQDDPSGVWRGTRYCREAEVRGLASLDKTEEGRDPTG